MDSRIIYECDKTYISKAKWLRFSENAESEWIHFGTGNNLNKNLIFDTITNYFDDDILYVAISRGNSFESDKASIHTKIEIYINKVNSFAIWNSKFHKVIQFNKIGVFRKGAI